MAAQKHSFANKVRTTAHRLAPAEFSPAELALEMDIANPKTKKRLSTTIRDLLRAGEIRRIKEGAYLWVGKGGQNEKRQIMWRLLRMRRTVSVDDLMELAGVAREYALEWLRMLVRQEVVKKTGSEDKSKYRLINEAAEMPDDERKAAKLRRLRRKQKKEALAALEQADAAISAARQAINNIGE